MRSAYLARAPRPTRLVGRLDLRSANARGDLGYSPQISLRRGATTSVYAHAAGVLAESLLDQAACNVFEMRGNSILEIKHHRVSTRFEDLNKKLFRVTGGE